MTKNYTIISSEPTCNKEELKWGFVAQKNTCVSEFEDLLSFVKRIELSLCTASSLTGKLLDEGFSYKSQNYYVTHDASSKKLYAFNNKNQSLFGELSLASPENSKNDAEVLSIKISNNRCSAYIYVNNHTEKSQSLIVSDDIDKPINELTSLSVNSSASNITEEPASLIDNEYPWYSFKSISSHIYNSPVTITLGILFITTAGLYNSALRRERELKKSTDMALGKMITTLSKVDYITLITSQIKKDLTQITVETIEGIVSNILDSSNAIDLEFKTLMDKMIKLFDPYEHELLIENFSSADTIEEKINILSEILDKQEATADTSTTFEHSQIFPPTEDPVLGCITPVRLVIDQHRKNSIKLFDSLEVNPLGVDQFGKTIGIFDEQPS